MQGASPLASPGAEPARRLLALPLWYPAGGVPPALPARRALAVPCGGLPSLSPAHPAFGLLSCPLSPRPPSPVGKGETISLFRRGLRPRHPCIKPFAALIVPDKQVPSAAGSLRFGAKPIEHAFLWAVPAAKERGDRGRGTSAFEMVLSPGAGRTSAVGGKPPQDTTAAGRAGNPGGKPPKKSPIRQISHILSV